MSREPHEKCTTHNRSYCGQPQCKKEERRTDSFREGRRVPDNAENVSVKSYEPGEHRCCCGKPDCIDFETRMEKIGIPPEEVTVVEYTLPLGPVKPVDTF